MYLVSVGGVDIDELGEFHDSTERAPRAEKGRGRRTETKRQPLLYSRYRITILHLFGRGDAFTVDGADTYQGWQSKGERSLSKHCSRMGHGDGACTNLHGSPMSAVDTIEWISHEKSAGGSKGENNETANKTMKKAGIGAY